MITEMRSLRLNATLITDMQRRYRDNLVIGQTCEFIISKISAVSQNHHHNNNNNNNNNNKNNENQMKTMMMNDESGRQIPITTTTF